MSYKVVRNAKGKWIARALPAGTPGLGRQAARDIAHARNANEREVLCGAKCPDHGEACSIVVKGLDKDLRDAARFFTGKRWSGRHAQHLCFALVASGGKPHTWGGKKA